MLKLSKCKGQFFVISSIILVSVMFLISQYLFDYGKVNLTKTGELRELDYIRIIKENLIETARNSLCERLEEELSDSEKFMENQLAEKGIGFSVEHDIISCSEVNFSFNITSSNYFSRTEFSYP